MKKETIILVVTGMLLLALLVGYVILNKNKEKNSIKDSITNKSFALQSGKVSKEHIKEVLGQLDIMIEESFKSFEEEKKALDFEVHLRFEHMQRVSYLSLDLLEALSLNEGIDFTDEEVEDLMIASYLHDIRKFEKEHAKKGASYVKEKLQGYIPLSEERLNRIGEIIYYHSKSLTDVEREEARENLILIQLLQDADAVDKMINQNKNVEKNYEALSLESSRAYVSKFIKVNK